jgi:uncharacterized protein YmfQ (DUF2313 family)
MKLNVYVKCGVLVAIVAGLSGCGVAGKSLAKQKPQVTQVSDGKFNISFFTRSTEEAGLKLKELATSTCGGRKYAVDSYKTQDYLPVYLHSEALVSCK